MNKYIYFLLAILSSNYAFAYDRDELYPHLFIGADVGYQFESDTKTETLGKDINYGIYAGSQLSESLSFDLGYEYHLSANGETRNNEVSFFTSAMRYDWYFINDASIYLRGGAAYWMMEANINDNKAENGFSPLLSAGFNYKLTPNVYLNAGYQFINNVGNVNLAQYDSNAFFAGITYHFKGAPGKAKVKQKNSGELLMPIKVASVDESLTDSMPREPKKIETIKLFETTLQGDVEFAFNRSEFNVTPTTAVILEKFIEILTQYPEARAEIVGHTDSIGSYAYNQVLSEKRANTVFQYLIQRGVKHGQVVVSGKGEYQPVATNMYKQGRSKNRRVELSIVRFEYKTNAQAN